MIEAEGGSVVITVLIIAALLTLLLLASPAILKYVSQAIGWFGGWSFS